MLQLVAIAADQPEWDIYLKMYCVYVTQYWPEAFGHMSHHQLRLHHDDLLRMRIAEGGRGIFLLQRDGENIGLCNAYIANRVLHIAEFYVMDEQRRRGYGKKMLELLAAWGRRHQAHRLHIEVDKTLQGANGFWSAQQAFELDSAGPRHIYWAEL